MTTQEHHHLSASRRAVRVTLIDDVEDIAEHARFLAALQTRGVPVIEVSPRTSMHLLAADVLRSLGKRVEMTGAQTSTEDSWTRALAWIVGDEHPELIATRVQFAKPQGLQRLLETASLAGADVTLIAQARLRRDPLRLIKNWDPATSSFAEFEAGRQSTANSANCARLGAYPDIPDEEFPCFLSRCEHLLAPAAYAQVERDYWTCHRRTAELLRDAERKVCLDDTAALIEEVLRRNRHAGRALVELRGLQAAAFLCGVLVKVNAAALASSPAISLSPLDCSAATKLRRYSQPRQAAAAALTLASKLPPHAIASLDMADVEPDATAVRVFGQHIPIDVSAQGIVRAHLAYRYLEGATPASPLFITEQRPPGGRSGRRFARSTGRAIQHQLTAISQETGLALISDDSRGQSNRSRWLRRQGISLHDISQAPASA